MSPYREAATVPTRYPVPRCDADGCQAKGLCTCPCFVLKWVAIVLATSEFTLLWSAVVARIVER